MNLLKYSILLVFLTIPLASEDFTIFGIVFTMQEIFNHGNNAYKIIKPVYDYLYKEIPTEYKGNFEEVNKKVRLICCHSTELNKLKFLFK